MRIKEEYKVREMAGEHIVVMQGRYGVDMTKVIALNETSLWLWNRLQGREFGTDDVRDLLLGEYDVDAETAERDAQAAEDRMAEARRQAAVHVPFAERPLGAAAVRAELDAELVRFFAAAMRDRRG